ncbi:MAG: hypothetical protein ACE37F_24590, partial [Nannocystaceae bacterium]
PCESHTLLTFASKEALRQTVRPYSPIQFSGSVPAGFGVKPRRLEAVSYGSAFELQGVFLDRDEKIEMCRSG